MHGLGGASRVHPRMHSCDLAHIMNDFHHRAQGGTTAEACRRIAVSEQTYYRWRKEHGGLKTDQARRMKDLEKENVRLRRAIPDLTLDKLILQEAARGNF